MFTQPNAGLAAARNHAIAEARGRYIFPLDSDDLPGRDFLEQAGGYCEYIVCYEDWDFWISMLKGGGEVARLSCPAIHYRIRKGSKRIRDRKFKQHSIDILNSRHAEFFEQVLCGPLHYQRTWSKPLNLLVKWCGKFGFACRRSH